MKPKFTLHLLTFLAVLASLLGSVSGVRPALAAPPAGLDAADWKQIQALLPPAQQAYLKASNTGEGDFAGFSISSSGDTIVVGAFSEDSNATGVNGNQADDSEPAAGAVYVFIRSGDTWSQQAYLKASNTETGDNFGISVAISGDTLVVGAPGEDSNATGVNGSEENNFADAAGAAYVFTRSGTTWSQQAYLKASNTEAIDGFGASVAISGNTIVVGAPVEDSGASGVNGDQADNSAPQSGAMYVFTRNGETWSQQAYLKASNTDTDDRFGTSIAISGDTIVAGAINESSNATGVNGNQADNSVSTSGAAYVFTRSGGAWSQQAYLKASNTDFNDLFGDSVSISDNTIVVGAWHEDSNATGVNGNQADNSASNSGAAYVFTRSGTTWSQQAYLKASNTEANDMFGNSVSVSGNIIVAGAPGEDSNATGMNGDQADNSASASGAAYVFVRTGGVNWNTQSYLKASNTGVSDELGRATTISGDTIATGAWTEDSNATGVDGNEADDSMLNSGAAYAFTIDPTFADVPFEHWAWMFIESIYNAGLTGGCNPNPLNYCPDATGSTRAQMAIFLLRGMYGPNYTPPPVGDSTGFADVPTDHWAAAWIKQLAAEGITGGCGNGNYCPNTSITREQMAVFLLRAKFGPNYTPPAATGIFNDVPADYPFAPWIEALAAEGITGGCGGGNFCPTGTVTRAQMAVFLVAAFNLP
ncbi:MAG: S-layer homology domain-containing protein [Chloroflexota bacterium]